MTILKGIFHPKETLLLTVNCLNIAVLSQTVQNMIHYKMEVLRKVMMKVKPVVDTLVSPIAQIFQCDLHGLKHDLVLEVGQGLFLGQGQHSVTIDIVEGHTHHVLDTQVQGHPAQIHHAQTHHVVGQIHDQEAVKVQGHCLVLPAVQGHHLSHQDHLQGHRNVLGEEKEI